MNYRILLFIFLIMVVQTSVYSHYFQFKDKKGNKYTIRSYSIQEVLYNNVLRNTADLKYKGFLEVISNNEDGAMIKGKYFYYNRPYRSTSEPYKLINPEHTATQFLRQKDGKIFVPKRFFYPVIRNVPTFPKKDLQIKDVWFGEGLEAQDLRNLGIPDPYPLPFKVRYRYIKDEQFRGQDCAVIGVYYLINVTNNKEIGKISNRFPARVMGYFNGHYYWDKKRGIPIYYEGQYDFIYILMNGEILEFKGIEYGDVLLDPNELAENPDLPDGDNLESTIKKEIEQNELPFPVTKKETGVSINLGELLFDFNSTKLKPKTIEQLDKLARILMKYDNYKITVEGHTDSIGTKEKNLSFSQKRAKKVRDYLVEKGVSPDQILHKGYGETRPVESNKTDEGRAKNRRVEIFIETEKK